MWYADDASVDGSLQNLRSWWNCLILEFGYYPNATKTCLIVKSQHLCKARVLFWGTGVVITDDGKCHPGSALGTDEFLISYVRDKVSSWVGEIEKLSDIAVTQPQAAYVASTVFLHHWSDIARTVLMSHDLYCPLDEVLSLYFFSSSDWSISIWSN